MIKNWAIFLKSFTMSAFNKHTVIDPNTKTNLVEKNTRLIKDLQPVTLIIDHVLGGGATVFRDRLIKIELDSGNLPLVFGFLHKSNSYGLAVGKPNITSHDTAIWTLLETDYTVALKSTFAAMQPSTVVINNLFSYPDPMGFLNSLSKEIEQYQSRLLVMAHDHYPMCPSPALIDYRGKFCNVPSESFCTRCLPLNPNDFPRFIAVPQIRPWRKGFWEFLMLADEVRFFSATTLALYEKAFPGIRSLQVTIIPHTIPTWSLPLPNRHVRKSDEVLRLGVVGRIDAKKGADRVVALAKALHAYDARAEIIVFGDLIPLPPSNCPVTVLGHYTRSDLPSLLASRRIDLVFLSSLCPETFSFTAEEVRSLGYPVVGYAVGAPVERFRKDLDCLFVPEDFPIEELARWILE